MTRSRVPLVALALLLLTTGCQPARDGDNSAGDTVLGAASPSAIAPSADAASDAAILHGLEGGSQGAGATPKGGPSATAFRTAYDWNVPAPLARVDQPESSRRPYLAQIHAADHPGGDPGYSRISFYFREGFPSYEFGYVAEVEAEGTGDAIPLPGNGFIRIQFSGARAHDDEGRSTITTSPRPHLGYPNLRGYGFAGDFEGQVTYGLGLQVAPSSDQVLAMRVLEVTRSDGFFIVAFDIRRG